MHIQRIFPFATVVVMLITVAHGQSYWTRVPTPGDGEITCLHAIGDTLLAGTRGGIYRSLDSGTTWRQTTLRSERILAIASNESGLVLAATPSGPFLSTDNGTTWTATQLKNETHSVAINRKGYLYAGTGGWDEAATVYRSVDLGVTWSWNRTFWPLYVLNSRVVDLLIVDENTIVAGTENLAVSPQGEIHCSSDDGDSWTESDIYETWFLSSFVKDSRGRLFAGSCDGRLLRSTDAGISWRPSTVGPLAGWNPFSLAFTADGVALLSSDALYRSTDASLTAWMKVDTVKFSSMIAPFRDYVFGGSASGLFASDDSGRGWRKGMNGIEAESSAGLAVDTLDRVWVSAHASGDHGRHWDAMPLPHTVSEFFADTHGWLFSWSSTDRSLYRSSTGVAWERVRHNVAFENIWYMKRSGRWLLFGGQYGLARSSDDGTSWERISLASTTDAVQTNDGSYFVSTLYEGVLRADSSGKNWLKSNNGLPQDQFGNIFSRALAVDRENTLCCGVTGFGLFRSTDDGKNWELRLSVVHPIMTIREFDSGVMALSTYGDGVFISTDRGATWNSLNDGLTNPRVRSLAIDEAGILYAGTDGSGVFRSRRSLFPCTAQLRAYSSSGMTARNGDTLVVPLRIDPPLKARDDLTLSASIRFDSRFLSFVGLRTDSTKGYLTEANVVGAGAIHFTVDGVPSTTADTLAQLRFMVKGTGSGDTETVMAFDSLTADTQCETRITSENIHIALLASPSDWNISLSPNPASTYLTVRISSPLTAVAAVAVTDLLGRAILRVFDGSLSEGNHLLTFNTSGLASGSYWVHLSVPGSHRQRCFIIVK